MGGFPASLISHSSSLFARVYRCGFIFRDSEAFWPAGVSILAIHSIAFPLWPRREIHPRFFCALPNTQFPVRVDVPLVCGLPSAWGGRRYSSQEKKPYPMWKSKPLYRCSKIETGYSARCCIYTVNVFTCFLSFCNNSGSLLERREN